MISNSDNYELMEQTLNLFESIKHIEPSSGLEFWYGHDMAKALGYGRYEKFVNAVERARASLASQSINPDSHIMYCRETIVSGAGNAFEVDGCKMTRLGAYYVAMNGDTRKDEVAAAQGYFISNTATVEAIYKNASDVEYIAARNGLRDSNRIIKKTMGKHGVKPSEFGIALDSGFKGLFNESAKELKEELDIPKSTNMCDVLGPEMTAIKDAAVILSNAAIKKNNDYGLDQVSDTIYDKHSKMRDLVIDSYGKTPESMLPGENVKSIERKHNKSINKLMDNNFNE
jgi:DNA-damage-inducible protein D